MAIPAHSRSAPDGVLFAALRAAALEAGRVIMKFYAEGCAVERKQDASPVTEADRAAEAVILSAIASAAPDIPVVAEEEASAGRLPVETGRRFLLVDPLDTGAITDGLQRMICLPELRARLSQAAQASVARFDWDHGAQQLLELFARRGQRA